ncbi:MAG: DUF3156 family protein [Actinomycetota bacterium]|nr:DUF3156 family protein [Actinomycetota bacterium]MDH5223431.1 DUF3156 family protein [Actinomycetota bacterium]MDH5312244.1 DUF3156 family protein [Actinomycetota bacterium]
MRRRARSRARAVLERDVEAFAAAGYREDGRRRELRTTLARAGRPTLRVELVSTGGRIFGGTYAMEVSTAEPVLPATAGGVRVKGRGVVRMQGMSFRPRKGDRAGERLAEHLASDERLERALRAVHFEEIRVEPDGRAVIRHMGGSLVWLLFPPMTRPIAISTEQIGATATGIGAFARAGGTAVIA